ncbi:unnamed protein product, partial [Symbiodinium microadriaticum]
DKAFDKPTEKAEDMYQQSVVLALKGWERAEKELESATEVLIFARSQWQKAVTDQNQEKQSTWDQNIKEAEKNVDKVKRDVDKAEEQFQKAAERLKEEEAKVSAAAPAQDPLVVKLSPLHVGEWRGLFGADGLLAIHQHLTKKHDKYTSKSLRSKGAGRAISIQHLL